MTWLGIDALVRPLRTLVDKVPDGTPTRAAAAAVVTAQYGQLDADNAALINLGVLAVKSRGRPPVYHCRPSASRVVHETDLRSIPEAAPPLLAGPGIIEARRPETGERLWGDVAALGWYPIVGAELDPPRLTDAVYLIGLRYPDGVFVARWIPAWTGEDLDEQLPYPDWGSSLIDNVEVMTHHQFAREAARYLVVFGLLEQVEDGPLRFEIDKTSRVRNVRPRDLSARGFVAGPIVPRPDPTTTLDPSRVLGTTTVHGHLKRVRVGKGREKIRWTYVRDYGARRWFAPRWTVERDHGHSGLANSSLVYRGNKP